MAQELINFRIDKDTKMQMKALCNKLGLNMSTALNMFIKEAVREQRLPLKLELIDDNSDGFYSKENQKILRESIAQAKRGELITMTLDDLKAMIDE